MPAPGPRIRATHPPRRHAIPRVAALLALMAALTACTAHDVGQAIYNTGKAYCAQHPGECDAGGDPPPPGPPH
jgi:hypothetical protein